MENILEIKSLCKEYEGFKLDNVSFSIPYGYIMGLIGPNGAGKTTIIKSIMNLIRKTSGEITVFGQDHIQHEVEIKDRIGFVYDHPPFYDHLSLEKMKSIIAPFYTNWDEVLFRRYISEFELPLKKKIETLSRGMRMKYALTIALSHHAELIIMDEPTSGLDPVFRRELLEILSGLIQDERKSILFSTHITSDLERIADFITYIHKGKLIFSCPKDDVMDLWGVVKGPNNWLDQDKQTLFTTVKKGEYGFEALTSDAKSIRREFRDEVIVEKATLEDIMYFTSKGGENDKQ